MLSEGRPADRPVGWLIAFLAGCSILAVIGAVVVVRAVVGWL